MLQPPDVGHEPYAPIRDDTKLAPGEDLDREPDGIPHNVVGLTVLFTLMLAGLLAFIFFAGGPASKVAAVVIAVVAIPVIVGSLQAKADRERDHRHPSR